MELTNQKIKHLSFGVGTVVAQDKEYVTVEFVSKTSKFIYPDAFTKFLKCEDSVLQANVLQEIADAKATEEAQKQAAEEEARALAEAAARKGSVRSASTPKKAASKQERIPGKRMTFYVFQGKTFDQESRGGYIWAPVSNKAGDTFHHWDRLLDVRPGDIIFHGCDGYIQAVSTARGESIDCFQPEELRTEDLWDQAGRRVDCDYVSIKNPIKTSSCIDDILRLCNEKYAPFDKDGNGNMGYLYELNRELARIFLCDSVKRNPYLGEIDFVQELLAEADDD